MPMTPSAGSTAIGTTRSPPGQPLTTGRLTVAASAAGAGSASSRAMANDPRLFICSTFMDDTSIS